MKKKHVGFIVLGILALMQVIRIDTVNPVVSPESDYLVMTNASPEIADILKTSCYDCHSNETNYPWYAQIAPVSWFLKKHINEGREHLNFSKWADYPATKQMSKRQECMEELEGGEMPLKSYTMIHAEAKLTDVSRQALIDWFSQPMLADTSSME